VELVTDGREALARAEQASFDVFLLDIHMPELDGFQVVRALREREGSAGGHMPVIALTARSRDEDRRRCLAAGMDDYLSKPIRAADLFAAIDRVVAARGIPQEMPPDVVDADGLIDPGALLAACGGVEGLLIEICRNFTSQAPSLLSALSDALSNQDATRLQGSAHKLYGTITAFSTVAGELASQVEDLAAIGHFTGARPLVGRLEAMVGELILQVDGLSIEDLRGRAGPLANSRSTSSP
jgi:CheY-like chemotaxis protein